MFSMQKILFPVDFSRANRAMLPYVADLAHRFRAELQFLHVIEDSQDLEKLGPQRAGELAAFAARIPGGIYRPQIVASGCPAEIITHYAEANAVDTIAMPTSGKGTLRRWMLGSVTETVLRKTSCAVWTESATGYPHHRWSPVLCAVDLEPGSEQVVSYASALAEQFHANLIVLHVVPALGEGSLWHPSDLPPALSESGAKHKLEDLLRELDLSAESVAETGRVEPVVGRVAERVRAQLLVIGRKNHGRPDGSLGAHTYELVRSAPCPVVSCPRRAKSTSCFWTEWQQEASAREAGSCLVPELIR
jgi:nucleotide-binding universal stress UspA family protein